MLAVSSSASAVDIDALGNTSVYYYVTDHLGSILQVLDADGTVVEQYAYSRTSSASETAHLAQRWWE